MKAKLIKENYRIVNESGNYEITLSEAFEAAAAAMKKLNEIIARDMDEDIYQQLMTAEQGVEELMDLIDSKLQLKHTTDLINSKLQHKHTDESLNEGFATEEGRKLNRIAGWLGYDDLEEMLGDNPGLFEVCVEWIDQQFGEQLIEELFQEGMNPEEIEKVGLWNVASEVKERYDDEPQM